MHDFLLNRFELNLVKEERVGEVLHVGGDGELPFQPEVELPEAPFHLLRQSVHSLTLLDDINRKHIFARKRPELTGN